MQTNKIVNLIFDPQWTSKLLHYFFSGFQKTNKSGIKTELLYLILPFLYDDLTRTRLYTASSQSTFVSIYKKKRGNDDYEYDYIQRSLINKNHQYIEFKEFTNNALIYLGNNIEVVINSHIIITELKTNFNSESKLYKNYCKAAYYLGVIFAKEDYKNILLKLGIINL